MWIMSLPWWEFILRGIIIYGFLIVLLRITGKRIEDAQTLVDVEFTATNQREEESARGDAVISLPSREHGPVVLPQPPVELQRRAVTMMERHGELLREGHTPAPSSGRRTG